MRRVNFNQNGMQGMSIRNYFAGRLSPQRSLKTAGLFLAISFCLASCRKDFPAPGDETLVASSKSNPAARTSAIEGLAPFKVMSFNIRGNGATDPQTLTQRRPHILQIIIDNAPDVVGLQEYSSGVIINWFKPQMASLGYDSYTDTLTASPKAIFYKTNRFTKQDTGNIRLGTPGIAENQSAWVVLRDIQTSKEYFISNSHWQYNSQPERMANAQRLADGVQLANTGHLPIIVFGDFNAQPGANEISLLKSELGVVDALGDVNGDPTFHGWDAIGDGKLDWMTSDRSMAYTSSQVITTSYGGYWPSDHWPVMATYVPAIFGDAHTDANGISGSSTTQFYFADINGDGKDDKIYWNRTFDSGKARVFLSDGDGTFASAAVTHTASASTVTTTRFYFADVNGDGKADLIRWDPTLNSGHTRVYLATSNGAFSSTVIDNTEGSSQGSTTVFNFADVNGDGKADKIYWNYTYDSGKTRVYLATSGGSFSAAVVAGTTGASTTAGTTFYYADVNGDGDSDKIVWHPSLSSGQTMVFLSDGDGTFTASSSFSSGATSVVSTTKFYFADINGDGRADKIYWNPGNYLGKLKAYFSQVTGSKFAGPIYSLRGTSQSANTEFYFADITGGGKADQIRWNYNEYSGELRNYFGN